MKALVVYESMFGNTEKVARAIADGLRDTFDVTVADVAGMPTAFGMDLLVVGGPTHAFSMSRPSTRESAAQRGTVRANAVDVGVREYLACSPLLLGIAAAAFDTKVDKPFLPGSAAHKAYRQLRRLRSRMVVPAESFLVADTNGPLVAGEEQRARRWGATLATAVTALHHTV
jgi:flavodoxin-like protein